MYHQGAVGSLQCFANVCYKSIQNIWLLGANWLINVDELNMNDVIFGYDVTLFCKYVDCTESSSPYRVVDGS